MQRYRIRLSYLGTHFNGWQVNRQDPLHSVQGYMQHLIQPLTPCLPVPLVGSGRTDAGVHATGQVCHVNLLRIAKLRVKHGKDTLPPLSNVCKMNGEDMRLNYESDLSWNCIPRYKGLGVKGSGPKARLVDLSRISEPIENEKLLKSVNARAMQENVQIQLHEVEPVSNAFHARFSAYSRRYQYRVLFNERNNIFEDDRAWCLPVKASEFCLEKAKKAAKILEGRHDFSSFRAASCQAKSPIRSITSISFSWTYNFAVALATCDHSATVHTKDGAKELPHPSMLVIIVTAPSFLHSQVRNLVGCLVDVGLGKVSPDDVKLILDANSRASNPCPTAPPQGLFLTDVLYPPSERKTTYSEDDIENRTSLEAGEIKRIRGQNAYYEHFISMLQT